MRLIIGLVLAILLTTLCGSLLRRRAGIFYVGALLLDALFLLSQSLTVPPWMNAYILFIFQSNNLAMGFFTIVMFTGVFGEGTSLRRFLAGIRAELSIVASLLCLGHVVVYGRSYLGQLLTSSLNMPLARLWATVVAICLVVLLIPLAVTSFKKVRIHLSPLMWRRLQKLAYLFYGLVFVHILCYLLPPALAGSSSAILSLSLYGALSLCYLVARLRRYQLTRQAGGIEPRTLSSEA